MFAANARRWVFFAVWALALGGQLLRFDTPLGRMNVHELAMGFALLLTPWAHVRQLVRTRAAWWWLAWILWTVGVTTVRFANEQSALLISLSYLARLTLYVLFAWWTRRCITTQTIRAWLPKWAFAFAAIGLGQYLLIPDTRVFFWIGWDDHLFRAFGTLFDPAFFGIVLALLLLWTTRFRPSRRTTVLQAMLLVSIALTFSRASYLALALGAVTLAIVRRSLRPLWIVVVFAALVLGAPKDGGGEGQKLARTKSIAIRQEITAYHTRGTTWDQVLWGRGWYYDLVEKRQQTALHSPGITTRASAVDNSLLHLFLSTGVVGMWLLAMAFLTSFSRYQLLARAPMLLAVGAHGWFSLTWLYPWVLLVMGAALSETTEER